VAGSGIFISPTGVTLNAGSVGSSLIIWTVAGLFNLLLALCYAELGTALPVAGGDYFYLKTLMGDLPAFLSLWTTTLLIAPCCAALMGRTVSVYLFELFNVECHPVMIILMAIWVTISAAVLNALSVKWSARLLTAFSIAKLLALAVLIITGFVHLAEGTTDNFTDPFRGSSLDLGAIIGGFMPGFVSYVGWDAVNNLAEEMENPSRDLPLSVTISMIIVTFIYVLTNIAYFSVLTPQEFMSSDAVAMTFARKALSSVVWMVPLFVIMSAAGSAIGTFLSYPRYAFAGARERQFPYMLRFVSLHHFTQNPPIILI
jgi:amino acid transporter